MNERIKQLRTYFHLTQQEFAAKIKVKRNTVATYEMGRSTPSDAAIALICTVFSVNEEWLRTGKGEPFLELSKEEELTTLFADVTKTDQTFKSRLISALAKLDDNDWNSLEKLITLIEENNHI